MFLRRSSTIYNYIKADYRRGSSNPPTNNHFPFYSLKAPQMANNQVQMKECKIKDIWKVWPQRSFEKQTVLPRMLILIVWGRIQTSFKCCGKTYEGQKTCLVNRYRYKKQKKQTGTSIIKASIDPKRRVTIIHTGVTPAKTEEKILELWLISVHTLYKLSLSPKVNKNYFNNCLHYWLMIAAYYREKVSWPSLTTDTGNTCM